MNHWISIEVKWCVIVCITCMSLGWREIVIIIEQRVQSIDYIHKLIGGGCLMVEGALCLEALQTIPSFVIIRDAER